jgi:hypothetical protein
MTLDSPEMIQPFTRLPYSLCFLKLNSEVIMPKKKNNQIVAMVGDGVVMCARYRSCHGTEIASDRP